MNLCIICGKPIKSWNANTCSLACRERKKFLDKIKIIQYRFKQPLKKIISDAYNSGKHMFEVAEILGINPSNTHTTQNIFNHFGIKRRPVGGFKIGGITDPSSKAYRKNKIRMIHNNPSLNPGIKKRMAINRSKYLLKNQSKMTKFAVNVLKEFNIDFIQEKPVNFYILDFAIDNINLEIDGKNHWQRKQHDQKRDKKLVSLGWKVIRIQAHIDRLPSLRRKLIKFIISGQIPSRDQT